ncbi:hypothetical protein F4818DRAFT_431996 [Hypoxylon cercidicola]|nr:hypothetical protein F4818DRAFT_431996 [Hypoxylon cercidicola]
MRVPTLVTLAAFAAVGFSSPTPQADPPETDICLQRKFLSAEVCSDIDAMYNNATLPSFGWYCCWYQEPFAPPPALPISAWITFAEDGSVANRCLGRGTCKVGLPSSSS